MNQNHNQKSEECMACSCPCEMHKEHNHPVEEMGEHEKHHEESKTCSTCGAPHKQDNTPSCDCH
ncbi:MAG: hypothetical protein HYX20_03470 [Candidatus Yanofskybacteria bacterium]|nr:hypothetical protein [Candidatus Yanofskybacteria bacterium]